MQNIIPFSENESKITEKILDILIDKNKTEEISGINNKKIALQELADSISLYPSIFREQHLGREKRTVETLVQSLCQDFQKDLRFHIPTKALLGNSFLIAKINFFYMLYYLTTEIKELEDSQEFIPDIITNIVFTLMAEEVFLSIIEDKEVINEIKVKAGYFLAKLWEHRLDHGVKEFPPILINIWKARGILTPTFGTMLGFSELFKISEHIEPAFFTFIQRDDLTDEEVESIEEFIFGLSYEETVKIKKEMSKKEHVVICTDDVEEIVKNRTYPEYDVTDPRELHRSFIDRKNNARYRTKAGLEGPRKTLEEYLMCYLLSLSNIIE